MPSAAEINEEIAEFKDNLGKFHESPAFYYFFQDRKELMTNLSDVRYLFTFNNVDPSCLCKTSQRDSCYDQMSKIKDLLKEMAILVR